MGQCRISKELSSAQEAFNLYIELKNKANSYDHSISTPALYKLYSISTGLPRNLRSKETLTFEQQRERNFHNHLINYINNDEILLKQIDDAVNDSYSDSDSEN